MTRTIPRALCVIPADVASHMRAHGRYHRHGAIIGARDSDALAIQRKHFPFPAMYRADRLPLRAGEHAFDHVVRVVDVLLDVIPRAAFYFCAADVEELLPRILQSE